MAQTTDFVSEANAGIEYSATGTVWVSLGGSTGKVDTPTQKRMTEPDYTFDGDVALIAQGKREPVPLKVTAIYSEQAAEAFEALRGYFQAGTLIYFRYSPKGLGATGRSVFTTANAAGAAAAVPITEFDYPAVDAASGKPIVCTFSLLAPQLIKTVTGSSTGLGS